MNLIRGEIFSFLEIPNNPIQGTPYLVHFEIRQKKGQNEENKGRVKGGKAKEAAKKGLAPLLQKGAGPLLQKGRGVATL